MYTFVMIKPDAVGRKLVGRILQMIEDQFEIVKIRSKVLTVSEAEMLYAEHRGKPFYNRLVNAHANGLTVGLILKVKDQTIYGYNAVEKMRKLVGATQPGDAGSETIRGKFGIDLPDNSIHASDSFDAFIRESAIYFEDIV